MSYIKIRKLGPRNFIVMADEIEKTAASDLSSILQPLPIDSTIPNTEKFRSFLAYLERLVPAVLREAHRFWQGESLDGILPLSSRKTAEGELEILGQCILITDQTTTPIHLRLQLSPSAGEISWMECRLGEKGPHGMVRTPYQSPGNTLKRLLSIQATEDAIEWVYKATFGERRT